jgi:hypothetical protein
MQGGSIEQEVTHRSVVTLMPTLATVSYVGPTLFSTKQKRVDRTMETVRFNVLMLRWMESMAYRNSVAFEVWHIAERTEFHDAVYDRLVEALSDYTQRGVTSWEHYAEPSAAGVLTLSPHVDIVYDADHERVTRLWRLRGYRVALGGTP